ncbi:MAG TPA: LysE family transporter [Anaerolineales bacterium]|nr:LysE family transporter [Anaerolineales bacterium]
MNPFYEGLLAGYGIAIPVGAIAVLIIQTGIRCGFRTGFMAGAGAASADFLYASLAAFAGATLVRLLEPIAVPLKVVSAFVLIGLAVWGLRGSFQKKETKEAAPKRVDECNPLRTYGQFLALTLINPLTVIYFAAYIIGRNLGALESWGAVGWFIAGAALSSLSWQTLLAIVGSVAHKSLPPGFQRGAVLLGNVIVLALGVWILVGVWGG